MSESYPLGTSSSSLRASVDFKANGEVSRMRSHKGRLSTWTDTTYKGNMPSLPQTKFCSLCPAKFTRTTHLNRHLRSHTNERSHRCEVCSAEFTRSDLLTRHKRTCGDSRNSNRSRRKSCQACAESKVKCNLQLPCSKCIARGRECVFINDPEASRIRKAARRGRSLSESRRSSEGSAFGSTSSAAETQTPSVTSPPTTPYSAIYPSPISMAPSLPDSMHSSPISGNNMDIGMPYGLPGLSHSSSSSSTSSRPSSRPEPFDMVEFNFDTLDIDCQFNDFFPLPHGQAQQDTSFLADLISGSSNCSPDGPNFSTGSDPGDIFNGMRSDQGLSYHPPQPHDQDLLHNLNALTSPPYSLPSPSSSSAHHTLPTGSVLDGPLFSESSVSGLTSYTDTEGIYLNAFFTKFSAEIPLIHRPTWTMEDKHPMLVSAMQACGAIYVKTPSSLAFVQRTLEYLGDNLIAEFSKPNCTLKDRFSLIMAVVLLQSWNLLSRQPDRLGTSRLFHGVVVTMIRRIGLIRLLSTWTPPDLSNHYTLDTAWREWARFETLKRVVFFAYVQDCANCAYFSMMPIFHPSEIEIPLPCDDNLWTAENVKEWYQMLQTPSPYAVGPRRLTAVSMRRALAALDNPGPSGMPLHINPFSHLILIHTILRNIFASGFDDIFADDPPATSQQAHILEAAAATQTKNLSNQYALHNWLQMWRSNPDAILLEKAGFAATPIFCAAAPFYWLAHYSLQANREGALDMSPAPTENEAQERCRLINSWMTRIQAYLRKGIPLPSRIQELMSAGKELESDNVPVLSGALMAMLDHR
ncbi:fungal-specific transcription factor domain-containing protein [Ephemerocybe angulata]|uniref:Fungal-specific transcription factor domain-containing protein n=1 Tax=Ephemerocybe angulata TaxID=980116 RepID=A0A8H6LZ69_9AGAR|nr:fungal-specific transcription factor domain-containing protein [Tulosesus angulatus]